MDSGADAGGMPEEVELVFEDGLFVACFAADDRALRAAGLCETRRIQATKRSTKRMPVLLHGSYKLVPKEPAQEARTQKAPIVIDDEVADRFPAAFDPAD